MINRRRSWNPQGLTHFNRKCKILIICVFKKNMGMKWDGFPVDKCFTNRWIISKMTHLKMFTIIGEKLFGDHTKYVTLINNRQDIIEYVSMLIRQSYHYEHVLCRCTFSDGIQTF